MNTAPKIAFAIYDGFSALDFAVLYDTLARCSRAAGSWEICSASTDVYDSHGLHIYPTRVTASLAGFDLVVVPGGPGALERLEQQNLLDWLATAQESQYLAATGDAVLLLAAAGLVRGRRVAVRPEMANRLSQSDLQPVSEPVIVDGPLATASDAGGAMDLALKLCEIVFGEKETQDLACDLGIRAGDCIPTAPIPQTGESSPSPRSAVVSRKTGETEVEVRLDIDGSGKYQIDTGLPFLDHMLTQIAVHGLFDLFVQARGDLHIDPHHTVEDVALALGSAYQQALGDRTGIVRMASADCPMDESLAWAAVDFSGRPYSVIQAEWHGPSVGSLPVSLIPHFLESFALQARCNLHVNVRYGRDDHHQAEAIFKALARAMSAATRIDQRRSGQVPSSKGVLF
ncbi:MAG: imidazoleglycerol-phosphate dehydratase HisB [Chloroflexi bacterium]|nr:imidazoleglycerol-phosphate dehydratase HisB [Chloroflexota bacterium]